jgi:two-component system, response regulator / RNA-binding antiterminator
MMDASNLTIAVVGEDDDRAAIVMAGLKGAGYQHIARISDIGGLMRQLFEIAPDAVVIDLANPEGDKMAQLFQVSHALRRPVAMFVDQSDRDTMVAALEAGVSAYVVDGLKKERVGTILDMAITRFENVARLQSELESTRTALQDRKMIERAKGIVMKQKNLDEASAYAILRSGAMNRHVRMIDIAQSIVTAADVMAS